MANRATKDSDARRVSKAIGTDGICVIDDRRVVGHK